jgi:hypothetical protein
MHTKSHIFVKWQHEVVDGLSEWWRTNWTSIRRKICAKVRPTQTHGWAEAKETTSRKTASRLVKTILIFLISLWWRWVVGTQYEAATKLQSIQLTSKSSPRLRNCRLQKFEIKPIW